MGILPSVVEKPLARQLPVFDEPVFVDVAVLVEPREGPLHVGPDLAREGAVPCPLEIGPGEDDKKRRCVDAAVVAAEGDLPQGRQFALAGFVEDLSRFGVLFGRDFGSLGCGEVGEDAPREVGFDPEIFEGRQDSVPPEHRAEPGDARVRVEAARGPGDHHVEIHRGARQAVVEVFV